MSKIQDTLNAIFNMDRLMLQDVANYLQGNVEKLDFLHYLQHKMMMDGTHVLSSIVRQGNGFDPRFHVSVDIRRHMLRYQDQEREVNIVVFNVPLIYNTEKLVMDTEAVNNDNEPTMNKRKIISSKFPVGSITFSGTYILSVTANLANELLAMGYPLINTFNINLQGQTIYSINGNIFEMLKENIPLFYQSLVDVAFPKIVKYYANKLNQEVQKGNKAKKTSAKPKQQPQQQ